MNPLSLEGTTMVPTSLTRIRTFFRPRKASATHPEALQERHLTLPRRIDDPASAASAARALLLNRREDVTLVLYMDDRHRFVGHAVVAVGWVQASRLSARPIILGTGCVLVRYGRYRALHATEAEDASFRAIADAAARHGLAVVDHLVVTP
jgi:DNA repair protein RadC